MYTDVLDDPIKKALQISLLEKRPKSESEIEVFYCFISTKLGSV